MDETREQIKTTLSQLHNHLNGPSNLVQKEVREWVRREHPTLTQRMVADFIYPFLSELATLPTDPRFEHSQRFAKDALTSDNRYFPLI